MTMWPFRKPAGSGARTLSRIWALSRTSAALAGKRLFQHTDRDSQSYAILLPEIFLQLFERGGSGAQFFERHPGQRRASRLVHLVQVRHVLIHEQDSGGDLAA